MSFQSRKGGVQLPERKRGSQQQREPEPEGIVARIMGSSYVSNIVNSPYVSKGKQAADDAAYVSKRLLKSTGKAAWIAGTTFLILIVPLIIEMDREQQLVDLEVQQQALLGGSPSVSSSSLYM